MPSGEHFKALLRSYISGDEEQFLAVALQVAAQEARRGHGRLAQDLRDLVDEAKVHPAVMRGGKLVPLAQPRGELASLFTVSYPQCRLNDLVMDESTAAKMRRLIKEHRQLAKLQAHGLSPRRRLLLVGPPGTGKTMSAGVLSGELGLPLFQVRLEALITKFMGETPAKLRLKRRSHNPASGNPPRPTFTVPSAVDAQSRQSRFATSARRSGPCPIGRSRPRGRYGGAYESFHAATAVKGDCTVTCLNFVKGQRSWKAK